MSDSESDSLSDPSSDLAVPFSMLPEPIARALAGRGFDHLTPIQERVLDPTLRGRDLRLASQTGSGKTVAIGLVLAQALEDHAASEPEDTSPQKGARPFALVIAPTRELAAQIHRELTWLFEPLSVRVTVVAGGASYRDELRALRADPTIVVGTPGRLRDHLSRGAIEAIEVGVVVLDEADQMLDLGFRDELEEILQQVPEARRTHMVSATFPREVLSLAQRYQKDPKMVEGTELGRANQDISHVVHRVRLQDRENAIVNRLLMAGEERTLIFVRTRASASDLASTLANIGFPALALSGDLEQRERNKTLEAFRNGTIKTLVATDVAARGLDIPDVPLVIHFDIPEDSEVLTHRSGRTGRAGRKGLSVMLVPPALSERARMLYRKAGLEAELQPVPSAEDVLETLDDRLFEQLSTDASEPSQRTVDFAVRLLDVFDPLDLVTRLLVRGAHQGRVVPRSIHVVELERPAKKPRDASAQFVPFAINWGEKDGADPRRLLAMVCRRGKITGDQVGAIRIGDLDSTFEVASHVAAKFHHSAGRPDPRNPLVRIDPLRPQTARPQQRPQKRPRPNVHGWDPPRVKRGRALAR